MVPRVTSLRVHAVNAEPVRAGRYVLYWMIAQRRTRYHFGLQYAIGEAAALGLPLIVLEPLRVDYPWASQRLHRFVMDGMVDQARRFAGSPIAYYPYLEPRPREGAGLLAALARESALVVTDEYPTFFLPRAVAAAGRALAELGVRLVKVDSNGLLPLAVADKTFHAAVHFRRFLQRELPRFLEASAFPLEDPLAAAAGLPRAEVPAAVLARWPAAALAEAGWLDRVGLDREVAPVAYRGGEAAAGAVLERFIGEKLARYGEARSQPDEDVGSGLSPYLHFGHISVHEVAQRLFARDGFRVEGLGRVNGRREGFWGLSAEGESFFDELVTWRELGFNFAALRPEDYDQWESLPTWAQQTLEAHASDRRPYVYSREQLERAETHDALWNAAQRQLRREGRIHNYLRMLWGKKILEWAPDPRTALAWLIELNNRWSVDGRDPNSYSGIFWTLGRFDRPWGPERPIFGTVRYMTSENTARKLRARGYLARFGPAPGEGGRLL